METNPYAAADAAERARVIARNKDCTRPTLMRHPYSGRLMQGEELGEYLADRDAGLVD